MYDFTNMFYENINLKSSLIALFIIIFLKFLPFIFKYRKHYMIKFFMFFPYFRNKVKKQVDEAIQKIEESFLPEYQLGLYHKKLPEFSLSKNDIINTTTRLKELNKYDWRNGKVSETVYGNNNEKLQVIEDIYKMFKWTNPLHTDIFSSVRIMEAEIIQMVIKIFTNKTGGGILTSGGTESIILAVKAYRDYYRKNKGIKYPNIIVSTSIHASFDKVCDLMNIKLIKLEPNVKTRKLELEQIKKHKKSNTILIVGTAPSYSHGIFDDIKILFNYTMENNIGFHVDACLGGFISAFLNMDEILDFRNKGVNSLSVDIHKYDYAPKGTSVLLFRDIELRHNAYFIYPEWTGGIYATPTIAGSRSGCTISSAWATLLALGQNSIELLRFKLFMFLNI